MDDHQALWYVVMLLGGGIVGITLKLAFEYLKNKSGGNILSVILEYVKVVDKRTLLMDQNLTHGVSVAERNTESYHEFIIALNDLKNMIKADTDATKELIKEVRTQTGVFNQVLVEIKKNGNGKK